MTEPTDDDGFRWTARLPANPVLSGDPRDLPTDDWDGRRLAKADMVELHLEQCRRAISDGAARQAAERTERRRQASLEGDR